MSGILSGLIICYFLTFLASATITNAKFNKMENDNEKIKTTVSIDEKTYCKKTLDDDFEDDTILVVMSKKQVGINIKIADLLKKEMLHFRSISFFILLLCFLAKCRTFF